MVEVGELSCLNEALIEDYYHTINPTCWIEISIGWKTFFFFFKYKAHLLRRVEDLFHSSSEISLYHQRNLVSNYFTI